MKTKTQKRSKKSSKGQRSLFEESKPAPPPTASTRKSRSTEKSSRAKKTENAPKEKANAESLAKKQREISVSEFFTKNRHLLGFDSPRKALLTAVKEAVDNSLDACEDAGILPALDVQLVAVEEKRFRVIVQDNGPGIVKAQVPKIFGKLLYGSKFHTLKQQRGQQGIGISAAGMYGQLTTGKPVIIISKTGKKQKAHRFVITIDTNKNAPVILEESELDWEPDHGTRVEIEMEGVYQKGDRSIDAFLKQVAIANPHVSIRYVDGKGETQEFERAVKQLPLETEEIKPHPYGVELGMLLRMLHGTNSRWVSGFLQEEFSRVGAKTAKQICATAGLSDRSKPKSLGPAQADKLHKAIQNTKIMAPPTSCIAPIGEEKVVAGLKKEVDADFYTASTRSPSVYRGNPFLIEVGIAYGRPGEAFQLDEKGKIMPGRRKKPEEEENLIGLAEEPIRLLRFANRVPLLFQQSACAITKSVVGTNWRSYALQQPRGALPVGPMVLFVHIASVWVPFTSESKEAIASYPEIIKEIKLAIQEAGRKLAAFIRKGRRISDEFKKRSYIEKYIPHIGIALQEILDLTEKERDRTVDNLTDTLEKSRKLG